MKKLIGMIVALLFLVTITEAAADKHRFLIKMEDAIYNGSRSGKLSKREVRNLKFELNNYEKLVWKYQSNGKISKRESRKLNVQQNIFQDKLQNALFNAERANRGKASKKKKRKNAQIKTNKVNRKVNGPICRLPPRPARNDRY